MPVRWITDLLIISLLGCIIENHIKQLVAPSLLNHFGDMIIVEDLYCATSIKVNLIEVCTKLGYDEKIMSWITKTIKSTEMTDFISKLWI